LRGRRAFGALGEFHVRERNRILAAHNEPVLGQVGRIDDLPLRAVEMFWVRVEMTSGISNREIAKALRISDGTVRNHVSSIFSKLGVNDRTKAVLYALQKRLV
jgi:ATP/maltotriose-dependent transcriptional regulator MalT